MLSQTLDQAPPSTSSHRTRDLATFLFATFALTWGLAAVALFAPEVVTLVTGRPFGTTNPLYFLAVYAPSVVGVVMIGARSGFAGLAELTARLFRWRVHPGYYALVLLVPAGIAGVSLYRAGQMVPA